MLSLYSNTAALGHNGYDAAGSSSYYVSTSATTSTKVAATTARGAVGDQPDQVHRRRLTAGKDRFPHR